MSIIGRKERKPGSFLVDAASNPPHTTPSPPLLRLLVVHRAGHGLLGLVQRRVDLAAVLQQLRPDEVGVEHGGTL